MKLAKSFLAVALAASGASIAQAEDITLYITGSTAFRGAVIPAIEALYGAGNYACVYGAKSGVTSEKNASNVAFKGVLASNAGFTTIIKTSFAGSVGGVKLLQSTSSSSVDQQPGAKGWIPDSNIPGTNTTVGTAETSITFETGANAAKAQAALTDAFQSSALGGAAGDAVAIPNTIGDGKVGVIPFEWVVGNGVTASTVIQFTGVTYASGSPTVNFTGTNGAALTSADGLTIGGNGITVGTTIVSHTANTLTLSASTTAANSATISAISAGNTATSSITGITSNQAVQLLAGGLQLSQLDGNSAHNTTGVYAFGRNADSGTRISCLGESGVGITKQPAFHLIPTITRGTVGTYFGGTSTEKGGAAGNPVTALAKWPAESILGVSYSAGHSGYNGGGDVANALESPMTAGVLAPGALSGTTNSVMVAYLGRGDASTACSQLTGQNTAHRITFDGTQDWDATTGFAASGVPNSGFTNTAIQEGQYKAWEFEHFYESAATVGTTQETVLSAMATQMLATDPGTAAIVLSTMNVSKPVEGGAISHN